MKKIIKKIKRNIYLFLSILIHTLIFLIALFLSDFDLIYKKPLKYIQITDITQESNEIDNDADKLAQKSNKAKNEIAPKGKIDNFEQPSIKSKKSDLSRKNKEESDNKKKKKVDFGDLAKKEEEKDEKDSKENIKTEENIFKPKITSKDSFSNEETVDLDTKQFKYISYFMKIKRKIEMVWSYPKEAYRKGQTGKVLILMSLNKTGKLIDVKVLNSSGYKLLDSEAKNSILDAAPYPPFPSSWGNLEKLNIRVSFSYQVGSWGFR